MRTDSEGPVRWNFVAPSQGIEARFRRWNIALIVVLAFLVLGVFVVAKAPEPDNNASRAAKVCVHASRFPGSTAPYHAKPKVATP